MIFSGTTWKVCFYLSAIYFYFIHEDINICCLSYLKTLVYVHNILLLTDFAYMNIQFENNLQEELHCCFYYNLEYGRNTIDCLKIHKCHVYVLLHKIIIDI